MTPELHTLPNGFRIVTERMPGLKSASIGIWVAAGGRDERPEQNGLAHFLEHMAFKGTATRSPVQIAEAIEDVGGYMNAYTSREVTAYYARVLGADVPLALEVLADILRNSTLDEDEIEVERGVILSEIGQALDTPDDIIFDWLQEKAYPEQPLGRTILGPEERIRAFQRDDLARFVRENYGPGQMILSAAGDVDHAAVVAAAERLFGDMTPVDQTLANGATFVGGESRVVKTLEQAHIALGFESPDYRHPDAYVAQVYAAAMGGGMASRLFQEIRERRGLCYTIFAQAGAYTDTGMTTVYAGTSDDKAGDLARITIDEMKRAADDFSEEETARARAQMKAGLLMGLEGPSSRAERMARMVQIWGHVPPLETVVERIEAVTRDDLRAYAGRMATEAPMALAVYGPVDRVPDHAGLSLARAA
ncbi:peptidase, M16 family protein [Pseudooceanicola batsensis HTCC2597]|uniref:Peptidase, M16 family protein n=1 Tax=Pseudooceanicola batsensis (strain ATCC BAA-863 / DSM 15984 / KCTC 12145 / HTCC2597) TaxID=252305 RepID=A3TZ58_PSEBH|nr:pitrilysin family protein [Pseudooceanicola batsensis]EAQ02876.1 peptidase, M16 family protein [Pseudooceanicola batsensis HTCC2597]